MRMLEILSCEREHQYQIPLPITEQQNDTEANELKKSGDFGCKIWDDLPRPGT